MPLPPFLSYANLIVCERVLVEADGVLTAVRMIDVFFVPEPNEAIKNHKTGDPIPPGATTVICNVILRFTASVGYRETHKVKLRIFNTRGEWSDLGPTSDLTFDTTVEDAPAAVGFIAQLGVVVRGLGTVQICAFIDDQEAVRVPLTFTLSPKSQA